MKFEVDGALNFKAVTVQQNKMCLLKKYAREILYEILSCFYSSHRQRALLIVSLNYNTIFYFQ